MRILVCYKIHNRNITFVFFFFKFQNNKYLNDDYSKHIFFYKTFAA